VAHGSTRGDGCGERHGIRQPARGGNRRACRCRTVIRLGGVRGGSPSRCRLPVREIRGVGALSGGARVAPGPRGAGAGVRHPPIVSPSS
jgi:hypothetical protein